MLNEFDMKAEQTSIQGKYQPAQCKCGWKGTQTELVPKDRSKDRACPECGADFKRAAHQP